jgi:hypothetical protein
MPSMTLCIQCCVAQFQDIGYLSDSEGRSNKTITVIEEMTVRSKFLPDLTRIMNETKMTLMVKRAYASCLPLILFF